MTPKNHSKNANFSILPYGSGTYCMELEEKRIRGQTDEKDAMAQAIYKILSTQRYAYTIYSSNYGIDLQSLYGKSMGYALSEIKRRITEALTWDSRIEAVDDFSFEQEAGRVHCRFVVHTIFGEMSLEKVVVI